MKFIKQSLFSFMVTSAIVPLTSTTLLSSSTATDFEMSDARSHQAINNTVLQSCIQKYSKLFRDFESVNLDAIANFRQEFAERARSVDPSLPIDAATMSSNLTSLEPFLEQYQNFLETFVTHVNPAIQNRALDLLDETDFHNKPKRSTGQKDINVYWFLDVLARFLPVFGEMTPDEKALFEHAYYPSTLKGVFADNAHNTPLKSLLMMRKIDNQGHEEPVVYHPKCLDGKFVKSIERAVYKDLNLPFLYPVFGSGKFGIPFLTAMAIQNIFPHAYTTKNDSYHGLLADVTTPSGLLAHDTVHSLLGKKREELCKHIALTVEELMKNNREFVAIANNPDDVASSAGSSDQHQSELDAIANQSYRYTYGVNADDVLEAYYPIAIGKYKALHKSLADFHEFLMQNLLDDSDTGNYKEVMAGFFWFMRENPHFPASLYEQNNLADMMKIMVDGSIEKLNGPESWQSTYDPLKTSPVTGRPVGAEDSLADYERETLSVAAEQDDFLQYHEINLDKSRVDYLPHGFDQPIRFIDLHHVVDAGKSQRTPVVTLYHKWSNADDSLSILSWAGTKLRKPQLRGDNAETRGAAIKFLDSVRSHLESNLEIFKAAYVDFLQTKKVGDISYGEHFKQHFEAKSAEFDQQFRSQNDDSVKNEPAQVIDDLEQSINE